ncbi:MAG: sugar transferase [Gammaproteobacteria bacterium]|nr:sugar transferase [Gammaproteobacteria bacterium]
MELAPVGICTYVRLSHLRRTVDALKRNTLAAQTELFVFSDAPRPGDEAAVASVRRFAHGIGGFRAVHVVEREENLRARNCRLGMRQLIDEYGKMIFMEEDIVTSPAFLAFLNDALGRYANNSDVLSISGYCPPIEIPEHFADDVFALPRFNGWGFGIWKDRFDDIKMHLERSEVTGRFRNPIEIFRFAAGGWDMLRMLADDINGRIDALDVKIFYQQYTKGLVSVYPVKSLVSNIGHDGSGLHCGNSTRFDVERCDLESYTLTLPERPVMDRDILRANDRFRSGGLWKKAKHLKKFLKQL